MYVWCENLAHRDRTEKRTTTTTTTRTEKWHFVPFAFGNFHWANTKCLNNLSQHTLDECLSSRRQFGFDKKFLFLLFLFVHCSSIYTCLLFLPFYSHILFEFFIVFAISFHMLRASVSFSRTSPLAPLFCWWFPFSVRFVFSSITLHSLAERCFQQCRYRGLVTICIYDKRFNIVLGHLYVYF